MSSYNRFSKIDNAMRPTHASAAKTIAIGIVACKAFEWCLPAEKELWKVSRVVKTVTMNEHLGVATRTTTTTQSGFGNACTKEQAEKKAVATAARDRLPYVGVLSGERYVLSENLTKEKRGHGQEIKITT